MTAGSHIRIVRTPPSAGAVAWTGVAAIGLQQLLGAVGLTGTGSVMLDAAGVVATLGGGAIIGNRHTRRGRIRTEYGKGGWATARQLREDLGRTAMRQRALEVRPNLRALGAVELRHLPDRVFGYTIGTTVTGPLLPQEVCFGHRDVCMVIAPPQSGKTALLGQFIDAAGPVVSTSTKTDIYDYTAAFRDLEGDIEVLNPEKLGDVESTFKWDPTSGCEYSRIAQERASYLVGGASDPNAKDAKFWEDQAVSVLRAYLMAAALSDGDMYDVARWVAQPYEHRPQTILEMFPNVVPTGWVDSLDQILGDQTPANTRGSIFVTLRLAVAFMSDPEVARACVPKPGERSFNVERFLEGTNTLYMIAEERKHSPVASLFAALTGYIFEECKRLAAKKQSSRHDPPVSFILDEAALICPVPLHKWTSDSGGRGISIVFAVQSPSQIAERWGDKPSLTIRNNSVVKIYFGGLTVDADLETISSVCGRRPEDMVSESIKGGVRTPHSVTRRMERTITIDRLRELPRWHVLVLARSTKPIIVKIMPVWERKDVKAAIAAAKAQERRAA